MCPASGGGGIVDLLDLLNAPLPRNAQPSDRVDEFLLAPAVNRLQAEVEIDTDRCHGRQP